MRHREAAERTVLTAIAGGATPAALADLLFAAETDRTYADGGHSLDFINRAFECLDLVGWPAALPGEDDDRLDALPAGGDIRAELLDTFDRQQQVGAAARLDAPATSSSVTRPRL